MMAPVMMAGTDGNTCAVLTLLLSVGSAGNSAVWMGGFTPSVIDST